MVTVTGLPDNLNDGMQPYTVTVSPVSGADPSITHSIPSRSHSSTSTMWHSLI